MLLVWTFLSCADPLPGDCQVDGDCAGGQRCLQDLDLGRSYCAPSCTQDADCPAQMRCQLASDSATDSAAPLRSCVRQTRSCSGPERCNGLDDDCDGGVDGPGCAPISGCAFDGACGAFVCTAPPGEQATACAAPSGSAGAFQACSADDDCYNGLCEAGHCAPLCRPDGPDCTHTLSAGDRSLELVCAATATDATRPAHNSCLVRCDLRLTDCRANELCAWRPVLQSTAGLHVLACVRPDPDRRALGQPCSGANAAGDAQCQQGICIGKICTRACVQGEACAELGEGARCERRNLAYFAKTYVVPVCVRGP